MDENLDLHVAKLIVEALLRERERQESEPEEIRLARPSRLARWAAWIRQFRAARQPDVVIQGAVICEESQPDSL